MDVQFKLTGMKELLAQLRSFGDVKALKMMRTAARKAFLPVYQSAHQLALPSMDTGALMDAIQLQVVKPKAGDTVIAVGIRFAKKMNRNVTRLRGIEHRNPARRWHFVEFGTVKMAAKPFLRPAMDANSQQVLEILKSELVKGIQREARRRAKAGGA